MRTVAPLPSGISLPDMSDTRTVLRANDFPFLPTRTAASLPELEDEMLSGLARSTYAPRSQQAQQSPLLRFEVDIARADNSQLTRAKVLDRPTVQILLDHRRADIGVTRNCRRVSEPPADAAHDGGNRPLRVCFGLAGSVLGEG